MSKLLVYYAHPGHNKSRVNRSMFKLASEMAESLDDISVLDLYARYPRFNINIDEEQQRLLDHDIIVFQFPVFWYSSPSLIKEWCDLVLEYGFAYGHDGEQLRGKSMLLAVTAAGPESAYSTEGYQRYPLRTFLTPLERTAGLCHMKFLPPYVLFGSLNATEDGRADAHVDGYRQLLTALSNDQFDHDRAQSEDLISAETLRLIAPAAVGVQS